MDQDQLKQDAIDLLEIMRGGQVTSFGEFSNKLKSLLRQGNLTLEDIDCSEEELVKLGDENNFYAARNYIHILKCPARRTLYGYLTSGLRKLIEESDLCLTKLGTSEQELLSFE